MTERVVITGMGIVSSIGNNCAEVDLALRAGRSGVTFAPEYKQRGFRSQVYAKPSCDAASVLPRDDLKFAGPGTAWAAVAMREAIVAARLIPSDISNDDTGIIAGSGGPSTSAIVASVNKVIEKGATRWVGPRVVPQTMSSGVSACLAVTHKIRGVNISISSACATSAHCIGEAVHMIRNGRQKRIFAGGCEELDWTLSLAFDAMPAMSSRFNDRSSVASRAYDKHRDGFVIAGGAGMVVLESLTAAKARGAPILAEIVGYGLTSDGDDMVAPSGEGAIRCMQMALRGFDGNEIEVVDYINTHGTSTPIGDIREAQAIQCVFGHSSVPPMSSTKSLTGHSLGAAGVQELIYCILMQQGCYRVASAHIEELDPAFADVPIIRTTAVNTESAVALSNSFGFGGTNATLIIRQYEG